MDNSNKINGLTGIRAIAALWVLLFHSLSIFYLPRLRLEKLTFIANPHMPHTITYGFLGVDIFFILSGFVMSYTYYDNFNTFTQKKWINNYIHYLFFRLARIYPAFIFVFFAGSLLVFLHATILPATHLIKLNLFLKSLPTILTMTYSILTSSLIGFLNSFWTFNPALWTISIEWTAYLIFPLLVICTAQQRKRDLLIIGCCLLLILQLYIYAKPLESHDETLHSVGFFIYGLPAFARISFDFFLGYFGYRIFRDIKLPKKLIMIDLINLIAITLIIVMLNYFNQIETLIIALLGVFIFCTAFAPPITNALLANRVMLFLGEISYSIYLVHLVVLQLVMKFIADHHVFMYLQETWYWKLMAFLLFLICVIVISTLLYYCVERPGRRLIRKLAGRI